MKVYRLNVFHEEGDGDGDEYFSALSKAVKRRNWLIREGNGNEFGDYAIEQLTINVKLSLKQLILAILNNKGYTTERVVVVEEYIPKRDPIGEDEPL